VAANGFEIALRDWIDKLEKILFSGMVTTCPAASSPASFQRAAWSCSTVWRPKRSPTTWPA
jgi:hypothetical protein